MERRVLYSNNGVITDWSVNLENYFLGSHAFTFVADEDAIYLGARLPFNHLYFKASTANETASVMSVSYWDSGAWRSAVEVIDETAVSGVSLAQSGFVTWTPNKNYSFGRNDTEDITDLTSVYIYNLYWIKITFSNDLTASTALSWVGQKFSNDHDLGSEYSDLTRSSVLAAFESGKTDWEEQHIRAAEVIVSDLISRNIIIEKEQILERRDFRLAAVSKCACIIYGGLGDNYKDNKVAADKEYLKRIAAAMPRTDKNRNALEDYNEKLVQGRLYR